MLHVYTTLHTTTQQDGKIDLKVPVFGSWPVFLCDLLLLVVVVVVRPQQHLGFSVNLRRCVISPDASVRCAKCCLSACVPGQQHIRHELNCTSMAVPFYIWQTSGKHRVQFYPQRQLNLVPGDGSSLGGINRFLLTLISGSV